MDLYSFINTFFRFTLHVTCKSFWQLYRFLVCVAHDSMLIWFAWMHLSIWLAIVCSYEGVGLSTISLDPYQPANQPVPHKAPKCWGRMVLSCFNGRWISVSWYACVYFEKLVYGLPIYLAVGMQSKSRHFGVSRLWGSFSPSLALQMPQEWMKPDCADFARMSRMGKCNTVWNIALKCFQYTLQTYAHFIFAYLISTSYTYLYIFIYALHICINTHSVRLPSDGCSKGLTSLLAEPGCQVSQSRASRFCNHLVVPVLLMVKKDKKCICAFVVNAFMY